MTRTSNDTVANFLADISYSYLDPRIKVGG